MKALPGISFGTIDKMITREATEKDIPNLAILAAKTYTDAFGHTFKNPEDLQAALEEGRSEKYFTDSLKDNTAIVAEDNDILIGYCEFGPIDSSYPTDDFQEGDQEIRRLYVLQNYQKMGIGKKLLDKAFGYDQIKKAQNVYLDVWEKNIGAQKLYKSYGFEFTGKVVDGDFIMRRKNSSSIIVR